MPVARRVATGPRLEGSRRPVPCRARGMAPHGTPRRL